MVTKNTKEHSVNLITRDSMTNTEFDAIIEKGLKQANEDQSYPVDDVFASIRQKLQ